MSSQWLRPELLERAENLVRGAPTTEPSSSWQEQFDTNAGQSYWWLKDTAGKAVKDADGKPVVVWQLPSP